MLETSEDPALLQRFDISHDFGLSDVSASEDIALTRTSEFEPFDLTRAEVQPPVVIDERCNNDVIECVESYRYLGC
ncbi:hypothetical protein DPMN_080999 [Dreissena polymorpha]|uniref:Uncharacterized protein n=1 Tax=Dreissena polymorpha TaxID=45954 RepID=A0A9D4BFJ7_DREPO|nr:hypothetical protein DPMN_080999 [Dreissena polymorpha]